MSLLLENKRFRFNIILFILNFIYIFIIGLFTDKNNLSGVYYITISLIYFFSTLTVEKDHRWGKHLYFPLLIVMLLWVGFFLDLPNLVKITGFLSTFFFFVVIIFMVIQISKSKKIGSLEFLEAVNIYLLFGIAASILFKIIYTMNSTSLESSIQDFKTRADFIYFAFVTITTLGYGDVLPASPAARSITIFFSVAGQLYLTMIIAMLVGKYLNEKK
jgi:voltage-gated potassium channel Kch